jgi:hypothetical protein
LGLTFGCKVRGNNDRTCPAMAGAGDQMADDKDEDAGVNETPEPQKRKFIPDPFAKLTDQDWIDANGRRTTAIGS